jgi:hypothetical protein
MVGVRGVVLFAVNLDGTIRQSVGGTGERDSEMVGGEGDVCLEINSVFFAINSATRAVSSLIDSAREF